MNRRIARIDAINRRILTRLQLDGRITNAALAEKVHLSPSACLERVRALEEDGVITRYVAEYDLTKLSSFVMLFVEVTLTNHRESDFERFLSAVRRCEEVVECFRINGRIDYLMRVICRDIAHYNELSDVMTQGDLGVEKLQGHVVLATDKAFAGYPVDMLLSSRER